MYTLLYHSILLIQPIYEKNAMKSFLFDFLKISNFYFLSLFLFNLICYNELFMNE